MPRGESVTAYLADTSVLTRMYRPVVAAAVSELGDVRFSPIGALEYLFQASNQRQWDDLGVVLAGFDRQPWGDAERVFERADEVQRLLAASGLKGRRVPDLIIAAHAELAGLTVLHYDADFDHIGSVTAQPTEWVVERGSVD